MEKYGFVYIWRDRKHNRYYVGCHWGTETDGYVCSSRWMNQAYKLRPKDFKRKIIKRGFLDRTQLFKEELRYLNMIKPNEIKNRYYNLNIKGTGHWSEYPENVKTIHEKIAMKTKEAMQRPDVRKNYLKGMETRDCRSSDLDVREKRRKSMMGKNKVKTPAGILAAEKRIGVAPSLEVRNKIRAAHLAKGSSQTIHAVNATRKACVKCGCVTTLAAIARYHNDKCRKSNLPIILL